MKYIKFPRNTVKQSIEWDPGLTPAQIVAHINSEIWRGPAEGKTVHLMKNGLKPMAMLFKIERVYTVLNTCAEQGTFTKHLVLNDTILGDSYAFCQPGQNWRGPAIKKIYDKIIQKRLAGVQNMTPMEHARIGILLGYSNYEIKQFINDIKNK